MTRKAQFGYHGLLIILVIIGVRFSHLIWQQQQTLARLTGQVKQFKREQVASKTSHQKVQQVMAKSTIDKASGTSRLFFNLVYNWSSGSDYQKRVKLIDQAHIVANQVLLDDYLFPKVGGMADYIDNNGLISRVDRVAYYPKETSDDSTSGVVGVTVNTKHDSDVGNGESRDYYFNISYQVSDNQISTIDYIGRLAVNQSTDFNTFNPYE